MESAASYGDAQLGGYQRLPGMNGATVLPEEDEVAGLTMTERGWLLRYLMSVELAYPGTPTLPAVSKPMALRGYCTGTQVQSLRKSLQAICDRPELILADSVRGREAFWGQQRRRTGFRSVLNVPLVHHHSDALDDLHIRVRRLLNELMASPRVMVFYKDEMVLEQFPILTNGELSFERSVRVEGKPVQVLLDAFKNGRLLRRMRHENDRFCLGDSSARSPAAAGSE